MCTTPSPTSLVRPMATEDTTVWRKGLENKVVNGPRPTGGKLIWRTFDSSFSCVSRRLADTKARFAERTCTVLYSSTLACFITMKEIRITSTCPSLICHKRSDRWRVREGRGVGRRRREAAETRRKSITYLYSFHPQRVHHSRVSSASCIKKGNTSVLLPLLTRPLISELRSRSLSFADGTVSDGILSITVNTARLLSTPLLLLPLNLRILLHRNPIGQPQLLTLFPLFLPTTSTSTTRIRPVPVPIHPRRHWILPTSLMFEVPKHLRRHHRIRIILIQKIRRRIESFIIISIWFDRSESFESIIED